MLPLIMVMTTLSVRAQFQGQVFKPFLDATVKQYGSDIRSPWCGGINSVQLNHADLNNDGKGDIILFDHNNNLIKTFINTGNAGEMKYTYDPKYEANFPPISYYMILKDYNCDNVPDLYEKGLFGVAVHKGYYQNNELKFTFFKDLFFPGFNGPVNVYVQPSDIPSVVDIDKDGDLDLMSYDVLGTQIALYKNMRVEDGLPCDSIRMVLADNCWGKFYQGLNRAVNLNIACKGVEAQYKKKRHTGNCIVNLDIEGDGDFDLLGGNISYNDLQLLFNNGSDIINAQDTTYNKNAHILQMPSWPSPAHEDIDNDGDNDILISCHNDNLSTANYNAIAYYKNTGTNAAPNFVYQHDTVLTPDMIDVGSYSYPVFYDYNKDGKPDLFIGTEGYLDNNTVVLHSRLAYYKNTTVGANISFELVNKDFLNLSAKNYKGIFPTFGDMTGDGVDDLVMGNADGTIAIYKNFAPNNAAIPNFLFFTDSLYNVFVNNYSMPAIFDFNQDGKTDLLIGTQAGNLVYYEDTSTAVNLKKMALKKVDLGNFTAGAPGNFYGYCAPYVGKTDNSQKTYLVVGNIDGNIERYDENFVNNLGNFTRIDSNYSFIKTPARAVPAFADLDGDGYYELVVGNKLGGLHYYKQVISVSTTHFSLTENSVDLYPNPVQNTFSLLFKKPLSNQTAVIRISDLAGRIVYRETFETGNKSRFDISALQPGVYNIELEMQGQKIWKKIIRN
jgi:hypothetical protein